jgi:predicted RNA-binding protein with PUA-like domain
MSSKSSKVHTEDTAKKDGKQYWLMKTEPDVFSIDDLKKNKTTLWEGVRNYQARNHLMAMKPGDEVLFYHSSAEVIGVAGTAVISKAAVADPAQFDKKSEYYEPAATKEKPRWFCPEVKFSEKFKNVVTLDEIKNDPALSEMLVIRKGQRLSVQPVEKKDFDHILKLAKK